MGARYGVSDLFLDEKSFPAAVKCLFWFVWFSGFVVLFCFFNPVSMQTSAPVYSALLQVLGDGWI